MKVKVTSSGKPDPAAAHAFASLLVAVMAKRPELKIVEKKEKAA